MPYRCLFIRKSRFIRLFIRMNNYEQIRTLGQGGFGKAILARRKSDKTQVVIKEVHEHASRSPQGRRWSQAVAMFSFTWMSLSVQSHTSLRGYFSHYPVKLHCMVS